MEHTTSAGASAAQVAEATRDTVLYLDHGGGQIDRIGV
jgi:hypothetical protein